MRTMSMETTQMMMMIIMMKRREGRKTSLTSWNQKIRIYLNARMSIPIFRPSWTGPFGTATRMPVRTQCVLSGRSCKQIKPHQYFPHIQSACSSLCVTTRASESQSCLSAASNGSPSQTAAQPAGLRSMKCLSLGARRSRLGCQCRWSSPACCSRSGTRRRGCPLCSTLSRPP